MQQEVIKLYLFSFFLQYISVTFYFHHHAGSSSAARQRKLWFVMPKEFSKHLIKFLHLVPAGQLLSGEGKKSI